MKQLALIALATGPESGCPPILRLRTQFGKRRCSVALHIVDEAFGVGDPVEEQDCATPQASRALHLETGGLPPTGVKW
ncbi:MAG: hypothetical protein ABI766_14185 [Gemmatimonadales bacterium]